MKNPHLKVVCAPQVYLPESGPKIFLAGTIGGGEAPNWQKDAIDYISQSWVPEPITIYNPRRKGVLNPKKENEQISWQIFALDSADYILMNILPGYGSPCTMLELGLFMREERVFLTVDPDYERSEAAILHYQRYGFHDRVFPSLKEAIDAMRHHKSNRRIR